MCCCLTVTKIVKDNKILLYHQSKRFSVLENIFPLPSDDIYVIDKNVHFFKIVPN